MRPPERGTHKAKLYEKWLDEARAISSEGFDEMAHQYSKALGIVLGVGEEAREFELIAVPPCRTCFPDCRRPVPLSKPQPAKRRKSERLQESQMIRCNQCQKRPHCAQIGHTDTLCEPCINMTALVKQTDRRVG